MAETGLFITKTIIVIRHAKSDWTTGAADFDRPLLPRGRKDAFAIGALLEPYDIDLVWCSAAKRTQETWEQACLGGAHAEEVDFRRSFYSAWTNSLISEMTTLDESLSTLALVNHQPTVGDLVDTLAQPSDLATQVAHHFPTSGVAILTYQGLWEELHPGQAILESFTRVRRDKR
ncbi:MAG: histidine phosphatase family protein [Coriobacteriia bacterium]|nr:histidine phosphatase family protein [Coriobacteriia bacterium]MCL2537848.1 histidine phosphatase family protein [Coriobacteriia bacterium]